MKGHLSRYTLLFFLKCMPEAFVICHLTNYVSLVTLFPTETHVLKQKMGALKITSSWSTLIDVTFISDNRNVNSTRKSNVFIFNKSFHQGLCMLFMFLSTVANFCVSRPDWQDFLIFWVCFQILKFKVSVWFSSCVFKSLLIFLITLNSIFFV